MAADGRTQVINQAKAVAANPSIGGFLAAFTSPMILLGSATVFCRSSPRIVNGSVTLRTRRQRQILLTGQLNFLDNQLSISAKLYADLSRLSSGTATILFLATVPSQAAVLQVDGACGWVWRASRGRRSTSARSRRRSPHPKPRWTAPRRRRDEPVDLARRGLRRHHLPASPADDGSTTTQLNALSVTTNPEARRCPDGRRQHDQYRHDPDAASDRRVHRATPSGSAHERAPRPTRRPPEFDVLANSVTYTNMSTGRRWPTPMASRSIPTAIRSAARSSRTASLAWSSTPPTLTSTSPFDAYAGRDRHMSTLANEGSQLVKVTPANGGALTS